MRGTVFLVLVFLVSLGDIFWWLHPSRAWALDIEGDQIDIFDGDLEGSQLDTLMLDGIEGEQIEAIFPSDIEGEQIGIVQPPQPVSIITCTEVRREFPQCGGTVGLEGFPGSDTILVEEFTNSCTEAKRFSVVGNLGNLGQCQTPVPQPQFQPQPQPPPAQFQPVIFQPPSAPQTLSNVSNLSQNLQEGDVIVDQDVTQNQQQSQLARGGSASVNIAPQSTAPVVITPQVVTVPPPTTVQAALQKELPKTGLPLFAWTLSGLLPLGLSLRKFGQDAGKDSDNPRYFWQQREFLKG